MTTIEWPCEQLPGPVPVRLEVPDDWLVEPAPNASFVAASPVEVGGMHANVVVTVRRIDSGISLEQVTDLVGEQLAEVTGAIDQGVQHLDLGDARASLRRFRIEDPASGSSVEQSQLICCASRTELVADVVTATLTYSPASPPSEVARMEAYLTTLRVG